MQEQTRHSVLLQIYLQEYQALTNRATTCITLIYGIGSILISYVVLIWYIHERIVDWYIWGANFGVLAIVIFAAQLQHDLYFIAYYLDTCLKSKIVKLTGEKEILLFESKLKGYRDAKFKMPIEGIWLIFLAAVIGLIAWKHGFQSFFDWIGFFANIIAYILLINSLQKGYNLLNKKVKV